MRHYTYRRLINQLRQLEARLQGKTPKAKAQRKSPAPIADVPDRVSTSHRVLASLAAHRMKTVRFLFF